MLEPDQKVEPTQVITVKPRGPVRMRGSNGREVHRDRGLRARSRKRPGSVTGG
jgi:hypothetical protein